MPPNESYPEVDGVTYMPEVYKIPMVRMFKRTDESANVRVYTQTIQKCIGTKNRR